jgi:hypothetical protein
MANLRFPWGAVYFLAKWACVSFSSLFSILVGMMTVMRRPAARWGTLVRTWTAIILFGFVDRLEAPSYTAAALTLETPRKPPKPLRAGSPVFLRGCPEVRGFTQSSPVEGWLVLRCVPLLLPATCILKHYSLDLTPYSLSCVWLRYVSSVWTFTNFGYILLLNVFVCYICFWQQRLWAYAVTEWCLLVNGSSVLSRVFFSREVKSGTCKQNICLFNTNTINFMLCRCAATMFQVRREGAKLFILKRIYNTRDSDLSLIARYRSSKCSFGFYASLTAWGRPRSGWDI